MMPNRNSSVSIDAFLARLGGQRGVGKYGLYQKFTAHPPAESGTVDCTDKIYDFLDKKSLSRPFRKCAALVCYLSSLQGDHSGQKKPLVDLVRTVSAANGLQL